MNKNLYKWLLSQTQVFYLEHQLKTCLANRVKEDKYIIKNSLTIAFFRFFGIGRVKNFKVISLHLI